MLQRDQALFPPPRKALPSAVKVRFAEKKFLVFSASIHNKVYRYVAPEENDILKNDGLTMAVARDEWESLQIGIWALADLSGVTWGVSDLVHENGLDRLDTSPSALRTYFVSNVFAKKVEDKEVTPDMDIDPSRITGKGIAHYREEPAALLDLPDVDVRADTARSLWLDLYVGPDTAAGRYHGTLYVKTNGDIKARHPLVVTVLPFTLDQSREWGRGAYISKFLDKMEVINLLENGHNQVSWWTTGGYTVTKKEDQVAADFSTFADYLSMLDVAGMTGPHVVFLGGDSPKLYNKIFHLLGRSGISNGRNKVYRAQYGKSDLSPPFEAYLTRVLQQFHQQMTACGHGDMPAVLLDEPDHRPRPERMDWYNKTFAMVEKQVPELPLMGVFYHKGDEKKVSHHHAVWSTNRPSAALYNACKRAGKKLYTYHGGFRFYDPPGKFRFAVGMIPWVYDAAGTFYWAIWNRDDDRRVEDDIFSPLDFGGQSTTIARAPQGADYGPLSTLIHKGFREAVDDARYIKTLEKTIANAMDTPMEEKARRHLEWLRDIQYTLRDRMVIRGGHLQNHTRRVGLHFPVAHLTFKNMHGQKCSLTNLAVFSDFIRKDVIDRILDLCRRPTH